MHYFRGGNTTNVRDEAAAAANSGDVSTGGRVMGSLPHGVSLGISLSLGGNWCGQVHRERWRHGRWREAPLAYFSFYTFSQPKSWILRSLGGHTSLYRHSVCPASRPGGCRVEVVGGMQTGVRHCRQRESKASRAPVPTPPYHSSCHKCVSFTKSRGASSPKTFVRQLSSLLFSCPRLLRNSPLCGRGTDENLSQISHFQL